MVKAGHAKYHLPPQLMLRASYYLYLDADAETGATSDQTEPNAKEPASEHTPEEPTLELKLDAAGVQVTPTQEVQQTKQRSRGAKAGIAVGVTLGVGLIVGVAVGLAAVRAIEVF